MASPLSAWREMIHNGILRPDMAQELAAERLELLHLALARAEHKPVQNGFLPRFWPRKPQIEEWGARSQTQGMYLYGPVGRGKSLLLDIFMDTAPEPRKRRVHFHAFMQECHQRLHAIRMQNDKEDAVLRLAAEISSETRLLCFDEFHVTDIADAMILSRLFSALFAAGMVVVATSNWPPERLYEGGLQRPLFLPFIELLQQRLEIVALDGNTDWRLNRLSGAPVWFAPLGVAAERFLNATVAEMVGGCVFAPDSLRHFGRTIPVPRLARGVCDWEFAELCGGDFGAGDYLALATHYNGFVVRNIPVLAEERRNETQRFIWLIDALYEHRCKLVASAEAAPEKLCLQGQMAFQFERTASRLQEMQSAEWWSHAHLT